MKHPFSRDLYAYWNERRGTRIMPDRADIEPGALRSMLGDSCVLSCDAAGVHLFRVAGTNLCALFGRELRGQTFCSIWAADSAPPIGDVLAIMAAETIGIVAGAVACADDELRCNVEILLLPLTHHGRPGTRLLGLVVPLERPGWIGTWPAQPLRLGVIRYFSAGPADPAHAAPLDARHAAAAARPSLVVIEGGR